MCMSREQPGLQHEVAADLSAVFKSPVLSSVQAFAVLQEAESTTPGNKVQIVFERQADIRPEALAELIEQARFAALGTSTLCKSSPTGSSQIELHCCSMVGRRSLTRCRQE